MRARRLRTDYLDRPLGIDLRRPRLSWVCDGGLRQTAYRIVAERDGRQIWDTGKVESPRTTHIEYGGPALRSRDRVTWSVTLWDETDTPGDQESSWFEMGLLEPSDWAATWITADRKPEKHRRYPVDCFRRTFTLSRPVVSARLYLTACGLYEARLGGEKVGDAVLTPGATDYRHRLQYQSYDVTSLVREGQNTLDIDLADGWYRGSLGAYGLTNVFGRETKVLCQLEVTHDDATTTTIASDGSFEWSDDGPIRFADLQDGEHVEASLTPSYDGWAKVTTERLTPTAANNVVPRERERLTPTLVTTPSGQRVLDFGQNIAGFIGFTLRGDKGERITLRLGEVLDESGNFTQQNFQLTKPAREFGRLQQMLVMSDQGHRLPGPKQLTPLQEVSYVLSGGLDTYRTRFAVFGFRYALVETTVPYEAADFEAVAVYSDLEQTGDFTGSHDGVNQLVTNTRWSMKGNFLDVPTDCPTRERLGWTGDAQIFFPTAVSLMDVAAFFRKWLADVRDSQLKSGKIPAVAPYHGLAMMYDNAGASVGWGDASILLPYRFWKAYGDEQVLTDNWDLMRRYAMFMIGQAGQVDRKAAKANPHRQYVLEKGIQLGEWLEPEEFRDPLPKPGVIIHTEVATAYLHYTMRHIAEIATFLGHHHDATLFTEYADGAKRAYQHLVVKSGTIDTDRQAKLVRPLALGLLDGLDDGVKERVQQRLVEAVERYGYRVGTGFLSTPFLLPTLTAAGRSDVAYRMLENTELPSWLGEVEAGATTVWEDWEGKASQNHYSPGAVCQWLFDTVAGVRVAAERSFVIEPTPGGSLTWAEGSYESPYGVVSSRWTRSEAGTTFETPTRARSTNCNSSAERATATASTPSTPAISTTRASRSATWLAPRP